MSTELVTIGCRLPNGYTLEVGYTASVRGGQGRQPYARYSKNSDYQTFTLKGTNQHLIVRDPALKNKVVALLPGRRNPEPFINQIPKDFWERWCKEHAGAWVLVHKHIYLIPKNDGETIAAANMDAQAVQPAVLQPIDAGAKMVLDDGVLIEKRTDE